MRTQRDPWLTPAPPSLFANAALELPNAQGGQDQSLGSCQRPVGRQVEFVRRSLGFRWGVRTRSSAPLDGTRSRHPATG